MPKTIGYHIVKSYYGLWLPGDDRGHWSEAWDDQIGFHEPHTLHESDPIRLRMAEERMKYAPVRISSEMITVIADQLGHCASQSQWIIAAIAIDITHMHLLITYTELDIHNTSKWIADQTTKAVHKRTSHSGPLWSRGKWCSFIYDESHWNNAVRYIEQHNIRNGLAACPYGFVKPR